MPAPDTIWNAWRGCRKEYAGCANCWAFYLAHAHGLDPQEITKNKSVWALPLKRKRNGEYKVAPFSSLDVCLTTDFCLPDVPGEWRDEVWQMIARRPDVGFTILTKRAHLLAACLPTDWTANGRVHGYPNVRLAITVENQQAADERIPYLLDIPASAKRLMCEPLLEEVHIEQYLASGQIDEVLCGGENYGNARVCDYDWGSSLSTQCAEHNVAMQFFDIGSTFRKDGKIYRIDDAEKRHAQAVRAGLDVTGSPRELVLKKHLLDEPFGEDTLF